LKPTTSFWKFSDAWSKISSSGEDLEKKIFLYHDQPTSSPQHPNLNVFPMIVITIPTSDQNMTQLSVGQTLQVSATSCAYLNLRIWVMADRAWGASRTAEKSFIM
jgi:hypothetical protein